ncbi:3-oxoacyl-[acyl-carrier protein] reductase [Micromonospora cremea]|uniref:3-oxoacyl-[acyl-carrier protein] reductase n=1 Tax=Micromonospora cremea TaxID=709881 RepID=A0A1N5TEF1_9ACTN|nr:3-oxoacyl-[acyl-carrier protein] reductase [Micromonospora cremea]
MWHASIGIQEVSVAVLEGMVAVVTGTAQGIGRRIGDAVEAAGAVVHRVDREQVDLSKSDEAVSYLRDLGKVDILVHSAGGVCGQTHAPIEEITDAAWDEVVDANLRTAFNAVRAVAPGMKERGYGRIVTISSGAGRSVSLTGVQAYTSAKAGLIGFTRQMAWELGPYGITVNCIAPGFVLSNPTTQKQWDSYGPDGQAALVSRIATRRTGIPEDIARGALFFVDPDAGWVSGQTLSIDGGHSLF